MECNMGVSQCTVFLLQELGLTKAQDTRIGGAFVRGISGGERKCVAFGQALLGNPAAYLCR